MKIYLTGISGTGKSSIVKSLMSRGIRAVDTDDGLCHWENKHTGAKADWQPNSSDEWHNSHVWLCDIQKLKEILTGEEDIVVVGLASNQDEYLKLFDKVFVLQASPQILLDRIDARLDNDFGKHSTERQRLLSWQKTFETEMIQKGAIPINVERPLEMVVEEIISAVKSNRTP